MLGFKQNQLHARQASFFYPVLSPEDVLFWDRGHSSNVQSSRGPTDDSGSTGWWFDVSVIRCSAAQALWCRGVPGYTGTAEGLQNCTLQCLGDHVVLRIQPFPVHDMHAPYLLDPEMDSSGFKISFKAQG